MKIYLKITLTLFLFSFTKLSHGSDAVVKSFFPTIIPETVNFGAISDGKKVIVSWNKTIESTFDSYTIERSQDGVNFVTAMVVKGAGKVDNLIDYTDIDYTPFSGISYYRLKQTNALGESYFSETVIVNYEVTKDGTLGPCTNKIPDLAELKEVENKQILVVLKNFKGEEFISKIHITSDTKNLLIKDSNSVLNKGTYMVVASSYNRLCSQTLLVK